MTTWSIYGKRNQGRLLKARIISDIKNRKYCSKFTILFKNNVDIQNLHLRVNQDYKNINNQSRLKKCSPFTIKTS